MLPLREQRFSVFWHSSSELDAAGFSDCDCGACNEKREITFAKSNIDKEENTSLVLSSYIKSSYLKDNLSWIFNYQSGSLLVVNNEVQDFIKYFIQPHSILDAFEHLSIDKNKLDEIINLGRILMLNGVLEPLNKQGIAFTSERAVEANSLNVWLHLTNNCNLSCSYCYLDKEEVGKLDYRLLKSRLMEVFSLAAEQGISLVRIKYSGGEPTLYPDLFIDSHILAEQIAREHNILLNGTILTNGMNIPSNILDFCKDHNISIAISLDEVGDGKLSQRITKNGKPSVSRVIDSIGVLQKFGVNPHISVTINNQNLENLPELVLFLLTNNLRFSLNFYRSIESKNNFPINENIINSLRTSYRIIENYLPNYSLLVGLLDRVDLRAPQMSSCSIGRNYFVIGINGELAPCQMLLYKQPVSYFLETDLQMFYNNILPVYQSKSCNNECPWTLFCNGGCPLQLDSAATSPYCSVYSSLIPEVIRLEALRMTKYVSPTYI